MSTSDPSPDYPSLPSHQAPGHFPSLDQQARTLPPVEWLWPGWLPRGMLSLLGGAPGAGKSLLALYLARSVIHGLHFPDGQFSPECPDEKLGPVIYVDCEAIPQIQNDRALAWGVNRSRLYLLTPPSAYGLLDFTTAAHQDLLAQMVSALQPEFVVVDSLGSVSLKGENNVEDVRAILNFLSALARVYRLAILLVHHLRKRGTAQPVTGLITVDDFRGSSHIVAMARSVLALSIVQTTAQEDRNGPRRLEIIKTNLCQHPPPLGIIFEPEDPRAPTLHFTDPPQPHHQPTLVDACAAWLLDLLVETGRPLRSREVYELAAEAGFRKGVVYRARTALEGIIVNTEHKMSPTNCWRLAEEA